MKSKLEPGPELDKKIAELIGLKTIGINNGTPLISPREWDEMRGLEHPTGDIAYIPFCPSTDLNAAFAAAEKVGLFLGGYCQLRQACESPHTWCVSNVEWSPVYCDTPALAVCAAILKLKEKE